MLVRFKSTDAPARKEKVERNKSEKSSARHGELLIWRSWTADEKSACACWAVRDTVVFYPRGKNTGAKLAEMVKRAEWTRWKVWQRRLATPTCTMLKQTSHPTPQQYRLLGSVAVWSPLFQSTRNSDWERDSKAAPLVGFCLLWAHASAEERCRVCALSPAPEAAPSSGEPHHEGGDGQVRSPTVLTSSSCVRFSTVL